MPLRALLLFLLSCIASAHPVAIEAIANLADPDKLATLGERGAEIQGGGTNDGGTSGTGKMTSTGNRWLAPNHSIRPQPFAELAGVGRFCV